MIRSKVLTAVVLVMGLLCVWSGDASGARGRGRRGAPVATGPQRQGWKGTPWLAGALLSAGIVVIGFKNAKRYHLD